MKIDVDAGGERWIPWAKRQLERLVSCRHDIRLPALTKVFVPAQGVRIFLRATEWGDLIKISVKSGRIEVFRGPNIYADEEYPYSLQGSGLNFELRPETAGITLGQHLHFARFLKSKGYHRTAAEHAKRYFQWTPATMTFTVADSLASYFPGDLSHVVSANNSLVALSEGTDGELYAWWAPPALGSTHVPDNAFWNTAQHTYSSLSVAVRRLDVLPFMAYCARVQLAELAFQPFAFSGDVAAPPNVVVQFQVPNPSGDAPFEIQTINFVGFGIFFAPVDPDITVVDLGSTVDGSTIHVNIRLSPALSGLTTDVDARLVDLRPVVTGSTGFAELEVGRLAYNDGGGGTDVTMSGLYVEEVVHDADTLQDLTHVAVGSILQADGPLVWGVHVQTDDFVGPTLPADTAWTSVLRDQFCARVTLSENGVAVAKEVYPPQLLSDHVSGQTPPTTTFDVQLPTAAEYLAENARHLWTYRQDGGTITQVGVAFSGQHSYGLDHALLGRQLEVLISDFSGNPAQELNAIYSDVLDERLVIVRVLGDFNGTFHETGLDTVYIDGAPVYTFPNHFVQQVEKRRATSIPAFSDGFPNGAGGFVNDVNGLPCWHSYGPSTFHVAAGVTTSSIQQRTSTFRAPGQSLYSQKNGPSSLHTRDGDSQFGGETAPSATTGVRSYWAFLAPKAKGGDDGILVVHSAFGPALYLSMALEDQPLPTSDELFDDFRSNPSSLPATLYNTTWFSAEYRLEITNQIDTAAQGFFSNEEEAERLRAFGIIDPIRDAYVATTRDALVAALGIADEAAARAAVAATWDPVRAALFAMDDGSWHTVAYNNFAGDDIVRHVGKNARYTGVNTSTTTPDVQVSSGLIALSGRTATYRGMYSFDPPVV